MAQTKRIDVRVPVALAAWVESYAESRASSRSAVVCWALREAMALAAAGVPEIGPPPEGTRDGRSARVGRVPGAGSRASSSPGAPAASSRPAAGAPALARCSSCGRSTWAAEEVGEVCNMSQPDGGYCAGTFAGSSAGLAARAGRDAHAGLADVVTGTGPRSTARAVPDAVRARQERLNRAKGLR